MKIYKVYFYLKGTEIYFDYRPSFKDILYEFGLTKDEVIKDDFYIERISIIRKERS